MRLPFSSGRTRIFPDHEDTTLHASALYPAQAARSLPAIGVAMGSDVISGEIACLDPRAWYNEGLLTSPTLFVMGEVGKGKSSFVKAFVSRSVGVFGREAYILDPKGEYLAMANALGLPSLRLEPGGSVRLNPLEPGRADEDAASLARRRASITAALASVGLDRSLAASEEAILYESCFRLSEQAILGDLVNLLLDPTEELATSLVTTKKRLADDARDMALALRNLVAGRLAGMLDAPSTVRLDETAPGLHLDLSPVYAEPRIRGPVMAASTSWLTARLRAGGRQKHLLVDEAWQILQDSPALVTWLGATVKLARSLGVNAIFVVHRISDLRSSGEDEGVVAKRAQGLLEDTQLRVLFAQAPGELPLVAQAMGLAPEELQIVSKLPKGRCLVVLGERRALWDVILTRKDLLMTDTDAAMRLAKHQQTEDVHAKLTTPQ